MKFKLTLFIFLNLLILGNLSAQEVKYPLEAKVENEIIPSPPGENYTWIKGHWEFQHGTYFWVDGDYVETHEGYIWKDGFWERNQKTGWWIFNEGYWQKINNGIDFGTLLSDKTTK